MSHISWLQRPYPLSKNPRIKLFGALGFGFFVFCFLWFFKPFGLASLGSTLFFIALGYGVVTFAVMIVINALLLNVLGDFSKERFWTIGKEVSWTLLNFLVIGLGNFIYSNWVFQSALSWSNFNYFMLYTVAIGVFPVVFVVFLKERRLRLQYENASNQINAVRSLQNPIAESEPVLVTLDSENQNESLSLPIGDLLFVQAAENYSDVYFSENNALKKVTLRLGIGAIETIVREKDENFFRCHKSFLVNKRHVARVTGNAQGYKLHLNQSEWIIPVSRKLNKNLKALLAVTP